MGTLANFLIAAVELDSAGAKYVPEKEKRETSDCLQQLKDTYATGKDEPDSAPVSFEQQTDAHAGHGAAGDSLTPAGIAAAESAATHAEPDRSAAPDGDVPAATAGSRRGRRPRQTAEAQVQRMEGAAAPTVSLAPVAPPATAGFAAPPAPAAPLFAPPGTGFQVQAPLFAAPSAPVAAVPPVALPPEAVANGVMSLDDFKARAFEVQTEAQAKGKPQAYPFNIMRADTWPNGAPKGFATMSFDQVPPDMRESVIKASIYAMSQA
jgi:hypothetical protein